MVGYEIGQELLKSVEIEAERRGVTVDQLIKQAIDEHVTETIKATRFFAKGKKGPRNHEVEL